MPELEERYVVLKIADIGAYLTNDEQRSLNDLFRKINRHRLMEERGVLKCIVFERDWPEYKPALAALTERVRQEQCEHTWQWHQIAGEGQICTKCYARNFDCDF